MMAARLLLSILLVVLAVFSTPVVAHECDGLIINDTNFTFVLSISSLDHGSLSIPPDVQLLPFTETKFQITSNFGLNDRIDYKWGYMLQQPNVCNNSSTTQVTGEFSYSYGSVSCSVANSACANNATIDVTYSSCSGWWNYSNPSFNIFYTPGNSTTVAVESRRVPAVSPRRSSSIV